MSISEAIYVRCALCGKTSRQEGLRPAGAFDAPDLDFRPPEKLRSNMKMQLMQCPQCGYVAEDIRKRPHLNHRELLELYAQADYSLQPLAHAFHRYALHCGRLGDSSGAARAFLCAAWVCDDAGDAAGAGRMRSACVPWVRRRMRCCGRKKWRLCMQLLADLLRRTGDVQALRALNTADRRLDFASRELLVFQKALAERRDFTAHSRGELDLAPYDDFFERRVSTAPDPSLMLAECQERAVSLNDSERARALEALDALRPSALNRPYHAYDGMLFLHRGLPIDGEHPFEAEQLAQAANAEFLDMLEAHVVSRGTPRESVTLQNKVCMAILHQLYTSPHLAAELRDHAGAQQRLYLMRMDDCFSEDGSLTGFIEKVI